MLVETWNPQHTRAVIRGGGKPLKCGMYKTITGSIENKVESAKKIMQRCLELDQVFGCRTARVEIAEYKATCRSALDKVRELIQ